MKTTLILAHLHGANAGGAAILLMGLILLLCAAAIFRGSGTNSK